MKEREYTAKENVETLVLEAAGDHGNVDISPAIQTLTKLLNELKIDAAPYTKKGQGTSEAEFKKILSDNIIVEKSSNCNFDGKKLRAALTEFNNNVLLPETKNFRSLVSDDAIYNPDINQLKGSDIPKSYWLKNTDINYALRDIFKIDLKTKKSALFENTYFTDAIEINSLDQSLELIRRNAKIPYVVYSPLNLGDSHWVYLKVEVDKDNKATATYLDQCFGNEAKKQEKKEELEKLLKKCYKTDLTVNVNFSAQQKDGWTCGYRVIGEIIEDSKHSFLEDHPIKTAYNKGNADTNALRNAVVTVVNGGNKVTFSDSGKKPSSTTTAPKWAEKIKANEVKPIFDKIFGGQSKINNGKVTTTTSKNCDIEYSQGEISAGGEPDDEVLKKMLQAMVEIKRLSDKGKNPTIHVETTPKNDAREKKISELAKTLGVEIKIKGVEEKTKVDEKVEDTDKINTEASRMKSK